MQEPIRVKTYSGETPAEAGQRYEEDAAVAAQHGWVSASQTWEGSTLTVTYQSQALAPTPVPAASGSLRRALVWTLVLHFFLWIGIAMIIGGLSSFFVAWPIAVFAGGKKVGLSGNRTWLKLALIDFAVLLATVIAIVVALFAVLAQYFGAYWF